MALVKYPKTPSKYMSLQVLEQILADNCIATSGQEYNEYELTELINQKKQKRADAVIAALEKKNSGLLQAWEDVEQWKNQVVKLQKKIRNTRKKYGF